MACNVTALALLHIFPSLLTGSFLVKSYCVTDYDVRIGSHLHFLGAVDFVGEVCTVVVTVTSPCGLDTESVVALKLLRRAVHVVACREKQESQCYALFAPTN
jgi:hypothetical protein